MRSGMASPKNQVRKRGILGERRKLHLRRSIEKAALATFSTTLSAPAGFSAHIPLRDDGRTTTVASTAITAVADWFTAGEDGIAIIHRPVPAHNHNQRYRGLRCT
jgi:hypothetical protein